MFRKVFALLLLLAVSTSAEERKFQKPAPVHLDSDGKHWAEHTLKKLTLEQKIGQMLMPLERAGFMNADSDEAHRLRDLIKRYQLGGIVFTIPVESGLLVKTLPYEAAMWTNQLQQDSELPLLIAADFERGPAMRLNGVTVFPAAMAFGATRKPELAERFGEIVASESRALGIVLNFFPVADVNSNAMNPIINTRSFGEDPRAVSEFVVAYIRGAKKQGMASTAKHFPGHGDTSTDTHLSQAIVNGDRARLDAVELPPFRQAIEAGVDAVMVAHVTVPALDPDQSHVATTSPAIEEDLLRRQLGFKRLVVTDAMDMNAVKLTCPAGALGRDCSNVRPRIEDFRQAIVDSVKAGADIVLQPGDLESAYNALLEAVRKKEISEARINESVLKILELKASVGLNKARLVDVEQVSKLVARPENVAFGQSIADQAITLVRDNGKVLPLRRVQVQPSTGLTYGNRVPRTGEHALAVVFTDDVHAETGTFFQRELFSRVSDAAVIYVDPKNAEALGPEVLQAADRAETVIALVAVTPSGGRMRTVNGQLTGSIAMDDASAALLHALLKSDSAKTMVVALGSPYLAQEFPETENYVCTFSNDRVSEVSAAKALFGEIPIHGRLPVTIPQIAARGFGMDRDVVRAGAAGGRNASSR